MDKTIVKLEEFNIQVEKVENNVIESIERFSTKIKTVDEYRLLNVSSLYTVEADIEQKDDYFVFRYDVSGLCEFAEIQKRKYQTRLQVARNICFVSQIREKELRLIAHPDVLYFDDNMLPKITIRHILKASEEKQEDDLPQQVKALVILLLNPSEKWSVLYKTNSRVVKAKKFEKIVKAETIDEIEDVLDEMLKKETSRIEKTMLLVSKRSHHGFKFMAFFSSILAVAMIIPLGYYLLFVIPVKNRAINATTYFFTESYSNVIQSYYEVPLDQISISGKYELAYSYVVSLEDHLSDETKAGILKSMSIKSMEDYLNYWIYLGRNQFEEAHEAALTLQDVALKYNVVLCYLDYLQNESDLKGSDKEEKIKEYTNLKESYEKEYRELIAESVANDSE